jgi:ubiquinone/menaquinone biosynthesis C-methylase UbiE
MSRAKILISIVLVVFSLSFLQGCASSPKQHEPASQQRFDNIEFWVKAFEDPSRDSWQKPAEVIKAMNIKNGDVIADLGAGTGYFTRRIAVAVGPEGKALGLEVEPSMVKHMNEDAEKLNLKNYTAKLVKYDDPLLEPKSVDVVFICDTYHHIENRVNYLKRTSKGLKDGGRVVVVDFHKKDLPVGPRDVEHKLAEETVLAEFKEAGYRLIKSHDILPYQYFLEFGL